MKQLFYLSLVLAVTLYACGGNTSKSDEESSRKDRKENVKSSEKDRDAKGIASCSRFLDEYEEWVDTYLDFLEDYSKNPMDPTLAQKYAEVGQEASDWYMKWGSMYACATREKYQKRFKMIAEKVEQKMKEIGFIYAGIGR